MTPQQARALYLQELEATLETIGGKSRKRTYRRMVRAVREHRGAELDCPDDEVRVWSDLHLGHENIIDYQERPFFDAGDMSRELWKGWTEGVAMDDVLVLVGDVAMSDAVADETWERIRATPGRHRHLVVGNHDLTGEGELRSLGFDSVWSVMTADGDPPLVFTHYPLAAVPAGHVNVHGHTHGKAPTPSPHINVSVEQLGYAPVSLARIRQLARVLVDGRYPPGETTIARMEAIEV